MARNFWVASDAADKEAALRRQAQANQRLLDLSRGPASRPSSHILGYSDAPGAREAHALIGTPDEIAAKLDALRDGRGRLRAAERPGLARQSAPLRPRHHAGVCGSMSPYCYASARPRSIVAEPRRRGRNAPLKLGFRKCLYRLLVGTGLVSCGPSHALKFSEKKRGRSRAVRKVPEFFTRSCGFADGGRARSPQGR